MESTFDLINKATLREYQRLQKTDKEIQRLRARVCELEDWLCRAKEVFYRIPVGGAGYAEGKRLVAESEKESVPARSEFLPGPCTLDCRKRERGS